MNALRHENCHDRDHGGGKRGVAGDESRELREKINPRRNYHVSRDGQIEPNVQAAKDSRCKRKLRLGDRRNFTPLKLLRSPG